ncbi:hypothetical protein LJC61_02250 [Ruminococcaceae bacterium OttesenSCG-928-A16]|nr:hypothetical protein [Ruminococcaceae bacterium OttesenSCG-928-A16]
MNENNQSTVEEVLNYMGNTPLMKLQNALPIVQQMTMHDMEVYGCQQKIGFLENKIADAAPLKRGAKILYGVLAFFIGGSLFDTFIYNNLARIIPVLRNFFIYLPVSLITAVFIAYFFVKLVNNNRQKNRETYAVQIGKIQEVLDKEQAILRQIYSENYEVLSFIPSQYFYLEAIQFFIEVLQIGRADNMKEAFNLFENHLENRSRQQRDEQMLAGQAALYQQGEKTQRMAAYAASAAEEAAAAAYYNSNR